MLSVFLSFSYSFYIYFCTKSSSLIAKYVLVTSPPLPCPLFPVSNETALSSSDVHWSCQIIILVLLPPRSIQRDYHRCDNHFRNCNTSVILWHDYRIDNSSSIRNRAVTLARFWLWWPTLSASQIWKTISYYYHVPYT